MHQTLADICRQFHQYRYGTEPKPRIPHTPKFAASVVEELQRAEENFYQVKDRRHQKQTAFDHLVAIRDVRDAVPRQLIRNAQERALACNTKTEQKLKKGELTRHACVKLRQKGFGTSEIANKVGVTPRHVRRLLNRATERTEL